MLRRLINCRLLLLLLLLLLLALRVARWRRVDRWAHIWRRRRASVRIACTWCVDSVSANGVSGVRLWRGLAAEDLKETAAEWSTRCNGANAELDQGRKLDPNRGPHSFPSFPLPSTVFPSPLPALSCLLSSPFLSSLAFHSLPFSSPPPMQLGSLGRAVSSHSGVRAEPRPQTYFAAIFSTGNVSGGSDFCFVL